MAVGFSGRVKVEGLFKGSTPNTLGGTTQADYYIDFDLGDDLNDGSFSSPFATFRKATETVSDGGSVSVIKKQYILDAGTPPWNRARWDGFGGSSKTYTVYGSEALIELTTNGNRWEYVLAFIDGDDLNVTVENMYFMTFGTTSGNTFFWENGGTGPSELGVGNGYCASSSSDVTFKDCKVWNDNRIWQNYINCFSGNTYYDGGESYANAAVYINQGSISYTGHTANYSYTGVTTVSKPSASDFRTSVGY